MQVATDHNANAVVTLDDGDMETIGRALYAYAEQAEAGAQTARMVGMAHALESSARHYRALADALGEAVAVTYRYDMAEV